MAKAPTHAPPARPITEPPSTGLHMFLKTFLCDDSSRDASGAAQCQHGCQGVCLRHPDHCLPS
ncbi:hypothetical protein VP01_6622g2 [Puccinia sorghi]|uniref:Uncharacterized protein n=1 Tax=Puccinia sorghi TaxID=27349 RepID=A0A0L6UH94_9BASI|nr:hypothetical protein VP01_6622g2 [Puccinia sorghi]